MAQLLTPADIAEINAALTDATDTFFKTPIALNIHNRTVAAFNEGNNNTTTTTTVNGLVVYGSGESDGSAVMKHYGDADMSEGYLLFNFADLETAGLTGANNAVHIRAGQDTATFNGETFTLDGGPNLVGPLETKFVLVKIHFKRQLKSNS